MKDQLSIRSTLKEQIFSYISDQRTVTFAQLRWLPGFRGDETAYVAPNIVIWADMSDEAIIAVNELLAEGLVVMQPFSPLWQGLMTYAFDGGTLSLPLARRMRRYKKPR